MHDYKVQCTTTHCNACYARRTPHVARRTSHVARRTPHAARRFALRASRFTLHASRFTLHASRFMLHTAYDRYSLDECMGSLFGGSLGYLGCLGCLGSLGSLGCLGSLGSLGSLEFWVSEFVAGLEAGINSFNQVSTLLIFSDHQSFSKP